MLQVVKDELNPRRKLMVLEFAHSHPKQLPQKVVEKVLELRQTYHLEPQRIAWLMGKSKDLTGRTSTNSIWRIRWKNPL